MKTFNVNGFKINAPAIVMHSARRILSALAQAVNTVDKPVLTLYQSEYVPDDISKILPIEVHYFVAKQDDINVIGLVATSLNDVDLATFGEMHLIDRVEDLDGLNGFEDAFSSLVNGLAVKRHSRHQHDKTFSTRNTRPSFKNPTKPTLPFVLN